MGRVQRDREIARRRVRKEKLTKYRVAYAAATTDEERDEIKARARKISPFAVLEESKSAE